MDSTTERLGAPDQRREIYDLEMRRAFTPIVMPTHDDVSLGGVVPVGREGLALKLELDPELFPTPATDPSSSDAVRKARLDGLDLKIEDIVEHAEEIDDAQLVDRCTRQGLEVQ